MTEAPLVAVTGATGFLGHHVLDTLARKGWRLRVLVRGDAAPRLPPHPVELVRGDLADEEALQHLFRWATAVVHLAGLTKARRRADFLAVIGAVWNHPEGPAAGVRAMNAAIAAALAD